MVAFQRLQNPTAAADFFADSYRVFTDEMQAAEERLTHLWTTAFSGRETYQKIEAF